MPPSAIASNTAPASRRPVTGRAASSGDICKPVSGEATVVGGGGLAAGLDVCEVGAPAGSPRLKNQKAPAPPPAIKTTNKHIIASFDRRPSFLNQCFLIPFFVSNSV